MRRALKVTAIVLGGLEVFGVLNAVLLAYLSCAWFIDDSLAFRMTAADW